MVSSFKNQNLLGLSLRTPIRTLSPTQQRLTEGFRRREADERAKYSEKDEVDLFNSVNFKRLEDLEDSRSEELDDSEDVLVTGFSPGSNPYVSLSPSLSLSRIHMYMFCLIFKTTL